MKKNSNEELKTKLFRPTKSGWENLSKEEMENILSFSDGYISFLNAVKTEREAAKYAE